MSRLGKIGECEWPGFLLQFVRYAAGSGAVLAVKVLLTFLLILCLNPWAAYFLVHVVVFFVSYAVHAVVTFRAQMSWKSLRDYFAAVALFKVLDYGVFSVMVATLHLTAGVCVIATSMMETILRFLVTRKVYQPTRHR